MYKAESEGFKVINTDRNSSVFCVVLRKPETNQYKEPIKNSKSLPGVFNLRLFDSSY